MFYLIFFSWPKEGHDVIGHVINAFLMFNSFLKYLFCHKLASFYCFNRSQRFFTLYCLWVIIIPFLKQNQTKTESEVAKLRTLTDIAS